VSKGDKTARNDSIKKYAMWMSAGGLIGPLLSGAIVSAFSAPLVGYRMAFVVASGATSLFMLGLIWGAAVYKHPTRAANSPRVRDVLSARGVFDSYRNGLNLTHHRAVQFGLTATFLIMYVQALYITFMPLYLAQNAYPTMLISVVIAMKGFAGMLSRFVISYLMRFAPLERILTTAGIVAAACVGLTPVAVETPAMMIALAILMGASVGINMPVSIMIMVDVIGDEKRGKLMGLRLLTNRLAQIISPLMFGVIGQIFGLKLAFLSGGAMLFAVLGGFAFFARRKWKLSTWGGMPREPAE
ncbi:MAG: MFS transporter, partial [Roseinatronobacter sp.]|nr:MFS transporter [Roseinatronobacter sp.]